MATLATLGGAIFMGGQAIWAASMVVLDTPLATMGLVAMGLGSTTPLASDGSFFFGG